MAMFKPPTKQTHSVELESLLILCKDEAERNKLVAAITDMQSKGQAVVTMDSKVRTQMYRDALVNAGISEETVESILKQGDASGMMGSKESQLAESYLAENLKNGRYVSREDVDAVVNQLQSDLRNGVDKQIAQQRFESSMENLCNNARKFNPRELAQEQIAKGKNGRDYEVYRKDRFDGLCISDVPKANISANKDQIVADLKEKVRSAHSSSHQHMRGVGSSIKQMDGDAEHMTKATVHMTTEAALAILSAIVEATRKAALDRALKSGDVNIQTVVNNLVKVEAKAMEKSMNGPMGLPGGKEEEFEEFEF